ncbi:hypothetical protein [Fibrella forsythiae]|uniref:Glycosyltransferase RgtA/B/C/D-like domain-containing protein n=1 Tax=Fibrella forsythiae TaxID=2817061 RepID=A0ABS3JEA7_9BACT|nr:hypothetical protein [Fibrella forsythiae]MBO0948333.1 hypothetical protein [Fibrella forsythiae]
MRPVARKTWLFSLLIFVLFAGSFMASLFAKRQLLWMDELLSYLLISDQSLTHLNDAIVSGLDANPPLFANLYWLLAHTVSMNVVFLKSVSVVLFASTLAIFYQYITYFLNRPAVNFVLVTLLAGLTFLNSTLATQIRAYPLFLLLTLLYFVALHQLIRQPWKGSLLLAHTLIGLLVVLTHNFGLFYVAAAGAFFGLLWIWSGSRYYGYALGTFILIGIGWLLIWYPSFAIQARAGQPHSWIPLPTLRSFFSIVGELAPTPSAKLEATGLFSLVVVLRFLGLIALFGFIAIPKLRNGFRYAIADQAFMLYLLAGFLYLTTLIITLAVSLLHTSVFISRYLWPSHLLVIYQLVYAVHYFVGIRSATSQQSVTSRPRTGLFRRFLQGRSVRMAGVWILPVYLVGLAGLLFYQSRKVSLAPTTVMSYVDQLDKRYPVFLESSINFIPVWFYSHKQRPVYFLLDRASAFHPANDLGASVGFHTLEAIRTKYRVAAIKTLTNFNPNQIPHFFVVDEQWNYQIERFIQNGTVRVIQTIPTTMAGITIRECAFTEAAH